MQRVVLGADLVRFFSRVLNNLLRDGRFSTLVTGRLSSNLQINLPLVRVRNRSTHMNVTNIKKNYNRNILHNLKR